MSDLRPLPIWPHEIPDATLDLIKRAKAELALPYQVTPVRAVPGSPGRILAIGELPPFVCDAALVKDPSSYQSVLGALSWALTAPEGDDRGYMTLDYIQALLGPGVVEITDSWDLDPRERENTVAFR